MLKLNVLVAGATGYIGVQLIKLLIRHKYINIKYLCGNSSVGKKISYFDKSLSKIKLPKIIRFSFANNCNITTNTRLLVKDNASKKSGASLHLRNLKKWEIENNDLISDT